MISARPTGAPIGAEVCGVDLSEDLDDQSLAAITQIWHQYEVIFFRNQKLTPEQFAAILKSEMAKWGKLIRDAGLAPGKLNAT